MRLTLRTLLAWLDDTLPPGEVRQIGHQVADSPFAQELVERIHKVTRRRRLTVPTDEAPDGADPNLVAAYLDNELPPEQVGEYERLCLGSDVHLAEVASAHQILSLISQKAKVPPEAKYRMYHLIKGREALAVKAARPSGSAPMPPAPVTEPILPWVAPEPPARSWAERYGPAAVVAGLIAVLCWSAWISTRGPRTAEDTRLVGLAPEKTEAAPPTPEPAPAQPAPAQAPALAPAPDLAKAASPEAARVPPTAPAPAPEAVPEPAAEPMPDLPAGAVGAVVGGTGALLRQNPKTGGWETLKAGQPMNEGDRIISLEPARVTVQLGGARADLVDATELRLRPAGADLAARFEPVRGRVVVHGPTPGTPFAVDFADTSLTVTPSAAAVVALERIDRREPGAEGAVSSALRILAPEGGVDLAAGAAKATLGRGEAVELLASGGFGPKAEDQATPAWATQDRLSAADAVIADRLNEYLRPGRPILTGLLEALEDPQAEVRRAAISALGTVGGVEMIVQTLRDKDRATRRAAIDQLRDQLSRGPDAAREIRTQLAEYFPQRDEVFPGKTTAATMEELLLGYGPKAAREKKTYEALVDRGLTSSEPSIRELALENLQALTGRDSLGFDPDKPESANEAALKAWKDLLERNELRPASTPRPR